MGLDLFSSKQTVDAGTHAYDNSLTQADAAIGASASGKGAQSSTAKDNAVSVTGKGNTVDQSLNLTDNSGTLLQNAKLGNGNSIAVSTTTVATDHGAVQAGADVAKTALAGMAFATDTALKSNAITTLASLDSVDKATASALDFGKLAMGAQKSTADAAVAAGQITALASLDTVDKSAAQAFDFGKLALIAQTGTTDAALTFGGAALDMGGQALSHALDSNDKTTKEAFDFSGDIAGSAIDAVNAANTRTLEQMGKALDHYQVATLQAINSNRDIAGSENASAERLITGMMEKFSDNQNPGLSENKAWIGGVFAVVGIVVMALLAFVFRMTPKPVRSPSKAPPKRKAKR